MYPSLFSPNAGKYRPEKKSVFGHFSRNDLFLIFVQTIRVFSYFYLALTSGDKLKRDFKFQNLPSDFANILPIETFLKLQALIALKFFVYDIPT